KKEKHAKQRNTQETWQNPPALPGRKKPAPPRRYEQSSSPPVRITCKIRSPTNGHSSQMRPLAQHRVRSPGIFCGSKSERCRLPETSRRSSPLRKGGPPAVHRRAIVAALPCRRRFGSRQESTRPRPPHKRCRSALPAGRVGCVFE